MVYFGTYYQNIFFSYKYFLFLLRFYLQFEVVFSYFVSLLYNFIRLLLEMITKFVLWYTFKWSQYMFF
jgi:hypothetical protein